MLIYRMCMRMQKEARNIHLKNQTRKGKQQRFCDKIRDLIYVCQSKTFLFPQIRLIYSLSIINHYVKINPKIYSAIFNPDIAYL